ncbi:MAG: GDP-mannose 4,6-dehydratase [Deltaproteobacteria bacterium]|nr:MAG: GDP-mannose 4,6-dehydratase [Deltaproteobacteria bacterium]
MAKRALITGVTGQDGAYLAKFLLEKGYEIYGTYKNYPPNLWRLSELGIADKVNLRELDLQTERNCTKLLQEVRPEEVYNLAAQSYISVSFEQPVATGEITGLGVARLLEAVRNVNPDIRFFQASSNEMFGKVREVPQSEDTPFHPRSPYAIAKLYGHWITINYREVYDIFTCSGILFNHESPLRGLEFVTRKITYSAAKIKEGLQEKLLLGNLNVRMDWGYAPEYVEAMWLMLNNPQADDYVIATGKAYSVREFVERAFGTLDIEIVWEGKGEEERGIDRRTGRVVVEIDPRLFRPADINLLIGDASKAHRELGWAPKTSLEKLVEIMVKEDLRRIRSGNRFNGP